MKRGVFGIGPAALAILVVTLPSRAQDDDQSLSANTVIQRTRTVDASYSSYIWNRLTRPGQPVVEEWSAEFHEGSRHRVETPRERVIADCAEMTGTALSLETGKLATGAAVAGAACGINANASIRSVRALARTEGSAAADRIEVVDDNFVRVYDVTSDGIIIRATYADSRTPSVMLLESWTVALLHRVPDGDMFSEQSLSHSFVPDEFRRAPAE